jgi:integrase
MRGRDLDISGKIWQYKPEHHKTAHRGHQRVIAIGPRAQEVLKSWLKTDLQAYLFSPAERMAAHRIELRKKRKTKVQPSQRDRSKRHPRKEPGDRYCTLSYGRAITYGIEKANAAAACEACQDKKAADRCEACQSKTIPHWSPHRLRHTAATFIRKEFGLDAARAVLGHRTPAVTEVYAELDAGKAIEVAEKVG